MNFANTYKDEAADLLADLEIALLELESDPEDRDTIGRVFRNLHTIKGSGAMFGFEQIASFTHEVESSYDLVREGKLNVTQRLISLTLAARDHLKNLLDGAEGEDILAVGREIVRGFLELQKGPASGTPPSPEARAPIATLPEPPRTAPNAATESNEDVRINDAPLDSRLSFTAPEPGAPVPAIYRIRFKPPENAFQRAINLAGLLREVQALGNCSVSCHTQQIPDLDNFRFDLCYLFWDLVLTTTRQESAIGEIFQFVEDDSELEIVQLDFADEGMPVPRLGDILLARKDVTEAGLERVSERRKKIGELFVETGSVGADQVHAALAEQKHMAAAKKAATKPEPSSLRVSAEKLDTLVNIVGEIVTMQARLTQLATLVGEPEMAFIAEEMERLTDKLRDNTMSIRMLSIGATFANYRRLVRDLSRELNKEVELITEGGETELDKNVIDQINDPLVHLIRNCVDHGLEKPEQREAAGKPRTGAIVLSASHSGAHVIIQIKDDGAGLDKDAIRQKGIDKGLIKADQDLTDDEIFALILKPGFSTAKTLSALSGRGVGMDIVKQNVEALHGTLEITSRAKQGTTFTLKLPLTLAIIDGLLIKVADRSFVMPLSNILECIELSEKSIEANRRRNFVVVRDEMVPYVDIREYFEIPGGPPDISQVMIAETREGKFGFLVDNVIGDHKTVIKGLGALYKDVETISGATILGDGTVALILDLHKLAKAAVIEQTERLLTL